MAPPRRGRLDKHRAILDAAAEIFGEEGYERASIDAIAAQSGVSKPTIYNHFGTKEQLFRESIAESAAKVNADSMAAVVGLAIDEASWRDALYDAAYALVQCSRSECAQSVQRQIYAEIKRDPDVFRFVWDRTAVPIIEALAGRLAMLANAGHLRLPDPILAARQFLALINTEMPQLTQLATKHVDDGTVRTAAARGVDTFLAAYGPR
jgi:TetR/AcrR family transcriptional regulator, mexJK operon transcriptional repressor